MSMRVTEDDVKAIIDTKLKGDAITPFLIMANRMVTDRLSGQYDAGILAEIEKNLAAHFISVRNFRVKSENVGDANVIYMATSTVGEGLASTPHGQTVMLLDHKRILSKVSGGADMEALG